MKTKTLMLTATLCMVSPLAIAQKQYETKTPEAEAKVATVPCAGSENPQDRHDKKEKKNKSKQPPAKAPTKEEQEFEHMLQGMWG